MDLVPSSLLEDLEIQPSSSSACSGGDDDSIDSGVGSITTGRQATRLTNAARGSYSSVGNGTATGRSTSTAGMHATTTAAALIRARAMELEVDSALLPYHRGAWSRGYDDISATGSSNGSGKSEEQDFNTATVATTVASSSVEEADGLGMVGLAGGELSAGGTGIFGDDHELDTMLSEFVDTSRNTTDRFGAADSTSRASTSSPDDGGESVSGWPTARTSLLAALQIDGEYNQSSTASSTDMSHERAERIYHKYENSPSKSTMLRKMGEGNSYGSRTLTTGLEKELDSARRAIEVLLRQKTEATEKAKQQDEAMVQVELEMTALAKQKGFVERERNNLREEIDMMRAQLAESNNTVTTVRAEQEQLIVQHDSETRRQEQRVKEFSQALDAAQAEIDELRRELDAKCNEVKSSEDRRLTTKAESASLRNELDASKAKLRDAFNETKLSVDRRMDAEAELSSLKAKENELQAELNTKRIELESSEGRRSDVQAELKSTKLQKDRFESVAKEKSKAIKKLQLELASSKDEKLSALQEVKTMKGANAELQRNAVKLADENGSFKRQLISLQKAFSDLKKGTDDAQAVFSDLEEAHITLTSMDSSLANAEREKACLIEVANELEMELTETKKQMAEMKENEESLRIERDEIHSTIQAVREELAAETNHSDTLTLEVQEARNTIAELVRELDGVKSEKDSAETEYVESLAKMEAVLEGEAHAKAEVDKLRAQVEAATADADAVRAVAMEGEETLDRKLKEVLEAQREQYESAMQSLQAQHTEEKSELQEKYNGLVRSMGIEKDKVESTLRDMVTELEESLRLSKEDAMNQLDIMKDELLETSSLLKESKQNEEHSAAVLRDERAKAAAAEELEKKVYEERLQTMEAESKRVINELVSELDKAKAETLAIAENAKEATSAADCLHLEATVLRESLSKAMSPNGASEEPDTDVECARTESAEAKSYQRTSKVLEETAVQTDDIDNGTRSQASVNDNIHEVKESLRQTKVELAAALTAFNLPEDVLGANSDAGGKSSLMSQSLNLLHIMCRCLSRDGPVGDADLEDAWQSLGRLRHSLSGMDEAPFDGESAIIPFCSEKGGLGVSVDEDTICNDDDSILRNLTLSFDNAFAALENELESDGLDVIGSSVSNALDERPMASLETLQTLDLRHQSEIIFQDFGQDNIVQAEGRFGVVLGTSSQSNPLDSAAFERGAVTDGRMLDIVPRLQLKCECLESERNELLDEKENLLNETIDLLECSRLEQAAELEAAVAKVRAEAVLDIARCREEYQKLLIKHGVVLSPLQQREEDVD